MPIVSMAEEEALPVNEPVVETVTDTTEEPQVDPLEAEKKLYKKTVHQISRIKVRKSGTIEIGINPIKKMPVVRYEMQRSTSKKFNKNLRTYTKKKYTNLVFFYNNKHLKKGKTYYYRARAVFEASDGTLVNGKWSKTKKAKSIVTQ